MALVEPILQLLYKWVFIFKGINEVEGRADVETTAFAAYAPLNRHIHVSSSNKEINVGEYVVFHAKV